jgi:hypothetical protein
LEKVPESLVDVLSEAGVRQGYGVSGDSLNGTAIPLVRFGVYEICVLLPSTSVIRQEPGSLCLAHVIATTEVRNTILLPADRAFPVRWLRAG